MPLNHKYFCAIIKLRQRLIRRTERKQTMNTVVNTLQKTKLFTGISASDIAALCPLLGAQQRLCQKGTVLIGTDTVVDFAGIVADGELNTFKPDSHGSLNLIHKIRAYELFGLDIACTPSRLSPLITVCATDAQIITFPYARIAEPGSIPDRLRCELLKNILELTANENMRQLYKIDILSRKSLRERIMLYLTLQSRRRKSNEIVIPFNREEFAAYLCVDRSALSRELGRMQEEGLITFEKNRFRLLSDIGD